MKINSDIELVSRLRRLSEMYIEDSQRVIVEYFDAKASQVAGFGVQVTPRQKDVLSLILRGKCNKEIAQDLRIAYRTVKFHVSDLLCKYDVQTRNELQAKLGSKII